MHPQLLADALLGIIDRDHNGKIEGKEIKGVLIMLGVPPLLTLAIPNNVGVEYRGVIKSLSKKMK